MFYIFTALWRNLKFWVQYYTISKNYYDNIVFILYCHGAF